MESFYGPSIPHSTSSILLEVVEDEKKCEDRAVSKSNDNTKEVLHRNVDEVINMILEEVLKEEDIDHVFFEEDPIVEASKTAEEVVWPLDDPNPVVIRAVDFHSLNEGQWLTHIYNLWSSTTCLLHLNSMKSTTYLDLLTHVKL